MVMNVTVKTAIKNHPMTTQQKIEKMLHFVSISTNVLPEIMTVTREKMEHNYVTIL